MSIESVNIYVLNDNTAHDPVEGVIVRVFDAAGVNYLTQATTDVDGLATLTLTAPTTYQLRFFKEKFAIRQPQYISTIEAPVLPLTNNFNAVGHVYSPPEAVHPRMCRCSGFFKRPDNTPAIGHDIHFIAKFDPILFEGDGMLTERIAARTDTQGFAQVDLVRFGQYDVTIEGFEDTLRTITIPDAPSVNLPDLIFPVVESIEFDPPGPWAVSEGYLNQITVTPTVRSSDGRVLPGTALRDVRWSSSDPSVACVLPTSATIVIRGLAPGAVELRAERADRSIIRIPATPIQGVPVVITVT